MQLKDQWTTQAGERGVVGGAGAGAGGAAHPREPPLSASASQRRAGGCVPACIEPETLDRARPPAAPTPIAICGLALRLPGGIRDARAFWDLLDHGQDARAEVPASRYHAAGFGDALGAKGAIRTRWGYFLDEDVARLDTSFFSLTQDEVRKTDPQQRLLLEVTRECLENAGETRYRGQPVGCYVGTFGEDWLQMNAKESQHARGYIMTGQGDLMLANRVSYEYDFAGPSMVIKTGCSASLVGLHEACRAIQSGDCTAAIVAGTNLILGPTTTAAMTAEGILAPDGSCKTFDASANGFARGEAITAVYIKRLDDALRDGNPIRAVIRNTGTNSDGRSTSLMAPNAQSHERLMRKVYHDCGLDPGETAFVECHGTGTATGDPIETTAVGNVFGERGVYIGSVKPNIGHSEGASGISSLIKAVLALEHGSIPPNIKFNEPNAKIPFAEKKLTVPLATTPWPADRARRISINSFGIGGSNAHAIVDAYVDTPSGTSGFCNDRQLPSTHLLLYSANTTDSLNQLTVNYQGYCEAHPSRLDDLAFTLSQHREHLTHRSFAIASSMKCVASPPIKVPAISPRIVMVFSGQGAQWPGMGSELLNDPSVLNDIRAMDSILQSLIHPPSWRIEEQLRHNRDERQFESPELSQPLCTAVQIALFNALGRNGVQPAAVVGHSSGEIAAAYASGSLSLQAALIISYYRGLVTQVQAVTGAMASIGLGRDAIDTYLMPGIVVACENSPSNCTISGDFEQVEETIAAVKAAMPDVLARRLRVQQPYHSHHMSAVGEEYIRIVTEEFRSRNIVPQKPQVEFVSTVTATTLESGDLGPHYWQTNLLCPVLFSPAIKHIIREPQNDLFLEIGPHSTLLGPLRQICASLDTNLLYIPSMVRGKNCEHSFLSACGQLYQHGVELRMHHDGPRKVLTDVPQYPWDHSESHWYESRVSRDWRFRQFGHHGLLGVRITEAPGTQPAWRNVLQLEDEPWLADHKIRDDVVFPLAGYCAMAGEAVRQLEMKGDGYRLRHVVAKAALVLDQSNSVEIITTLRPHRLTDTKCSAWWDFSISSFVGDVWVTNCEGQVHVNDATPAPYVATEPFLRDVAAQRWYEAMAGAGFIYGRSFQRLSDITASATANEAAATISVTAEQQQAAFTLHPAAIDASLQLLLVALAQGVGRNLTKLAVPTFIEELDVYKAAAEMRTQAWRSPDQKTISIEGSASGERILRISGLQMTPLGDESLSNLDDGAARLEWRPHFDFMDHASLFTAPPSDIGQTILEEELTLLCMIDSTERIKGLTPREQHFLKFRDWMCREVERAKAGNYPVLQSCEKLLSLSDADRLLAIEDRIEKLAQSSCRSAVTTGLQRIWTNVEKIFTGEKDTLDTLMEDNVLTDIYNVVSFGHSDFIQMLSHANPTLRILEVGAGTGGTTQTFLHDLIDANGSPSYSRYTFTDISAGFFPQAQKRFAYAPNMEYKVFDISKSPFDQGFEKESYDLVLAPNVVHATPSLHDSLSNLQPLLSPGGHLVLTELTAVARAPNYIFGNFSGWWLGEADGRPDEPYVSVERWDAELRSSGFLGVTATALDAPAPYQYSAVIVSQPATRKTIEHSRRITLLTASSNSTSGTLTHYLQCQGIVVDLRRLGDALPERQDIISILDLESNFFENISEEQFATLKQLLHSHGSQTLLFVTKPSQIMSQNPSAALSIGFARTARVELASKLFTLEIEESEPTLAETILRVYQKAQQPLESGELLPDREFAFHEGYIKVGRYHPSSLADLSRQSTAAVNVKSLEITTPGSLESLTWVDEPESAIGEGIVEVETSVLGVNFRDVVLALGILPSDSDRIPLGLELAGRVSRVGSNVQNLAVGDRVMGVAPNGCMATKVCLSASLLVRIPESLDFESAATMPLCYVTALQSLVVIGRVMEGDSVLIHSAAGGVGHAAIAVCKMLGATIYATVGSEEKKQYLQHAFGIPPSRIFDSRSISFADELMKATHGEGVDLVLNSLSGELLHASWKCVKAFGKLVELGKRDLVGHGQLNMEPFLANRSYCCVDVAQIIHERPQSAGRLLRQLLDGYERGKLMPIKIGSSVSANEAIQAFRALQRGDMIGKAVINLPSLSSEIQSEIRQPALQLDSAASYLITGGLGGLGKPLVRWMVEHGARSIVFLSRSAGASLEDQKFLKELASMNCHAICVAGKVQQLEDVFRAVAAAPLPIKGVVHLAMVLRDSMIADMTHEQWQAVIEPKAKGAWSLHQALEHQPLDFFVLASSLLTVVDPAGQSNYIASNTFLEAFCQFRRQRGLAASVLNIGAIDGIGFVAENAYARKNIKDLGLSFLSEPQLFTFMELAMRESRPDIISGDGRGPSTAWSSDGQFIMGLRSTMPLADSHCRASWRRDRRMGIYHNVRSNDTETTAAKGDAEGQELKAFLAACAEEPDRLLAAGSAEFFAMEIGRKAFGFMLRPVSNDEEIRAVQRCSLAQIGVDSLMAIELRRWCKAALGAEISVLEIMAAGTLERLGQVAAEATLQRLKEGL